MPKVYIIPLIICLEKRQQELDDEVENLRDIINTKEYEISKKEEEIARIKKLIELETSEKEIEIKNIRTELDDQRQVIEN